MDSVEHTLTRTLDAGQVTSRRERLDRRLYGAVSLAALLY